MAANGWSSNPFNYNTWLAHNDWNNDSAGDEFLVGDVCDLTAGSSGEFQGDATIVLNLANWCMALAGLNRATDSGVGVYGESDSTNGVGMGVVGACDMGWGVAGLAIAPTIDPTDPAQNFPRQVGVMGFGDNVGAVGYGWGPTPMACGAVPVGPLQVLSALAM